MQKLTLIDFPGKIACTIFTPGCNFRCGFCHNPELVLSNNNINIPEHEVLEFLENRKKYLDGLCITGGEPLINSEIIDFLKKIKKIGYDIKLDTNGSNPNMLEKLISLGLIDYVALDIKASSELYKEIVGVDFDLKLIEESIKILSQSKIKYIFRTSVMPIFDNTDNKIRWFSDLEVEKMAKWVSNITGKRDLWILQKFVSRKKEEILDNRFNLDNLLLKFHETPEHILENMKKIMDKYFEVEIV